uniref:Uncharacterized protein n=1 Tax=Castor canadensis TaxID=51338 RepID=A0A8C0XD45_CASCN
MPGPQHQDTAKYSQGLRIILLNLMPTLPVPLNHDLPGVSLGDSTEGSPWQTCLHQGPVGLCICPGRESGQEE